MPTKPTQNWRENLPELMLAGEGNATPPSLHSHGRTKQQQPEQVGATKVMDVAVADLA